MVVCGRVVTLVLAVVSHRAVMATQFVVLTTNCAPPGLVLLLLLLRLRLVHLQPCRRETSTAMGVVYAVRLVRHMCLFSSSAVATVHRKTSMKRAAHAWERRTGRHTEYHCLCWMSLVICFTKQRLGSPLGVLLAQKRSVYQQVLLAPNYVTNSLYGFLLKMFLVNTICCKRDKLYSAC
jgi:hypothetical protein